MLVSSCPNIIWYVLIFHPRDLRDHLRRGEELHERLNYFVSILLRDISVAGWRLVRNPWYCITIIHN